MQMNDDTSTAARQVPARSDDRVLAAIRRNVLVVMPELTPGQVQPERSLSELGCNSIDRAEVVSLIMEDLGVDVPVTAFTEVRDIGSLAGLLRRYA
jgi:polyketide biosynthesis acyl carrier protein